MQDRQGEISIYMTTPSDLPILAPNIFLRFHIPLRCYQAKNRQRSSEREFEFVVHLILLFLITADGDVFLCANKPNTKKTLEPYRIF